MSKEIAKLLRQQAAARKAYARKMREERKAAIQALELKR
jgi:hypothetical protein